jgi:nucleotide-binding universal stress UspA family protein
MNVTCVVVGVDGSANARRAVDWAAGLAQLAGARVVAVHALGLLEQPKRDEAKQSLEHEWCAPLDEYGIDHDCVVRDGNPLTVVLDVAAETGADVIVVGSRGLSGRLLLGSTSTQVAQQSPIPVVIVPEDHTEA